MLWILSPCLSMPRKHRECHLVSRVAPKHGAVRLKGAVAVGLAGLVGKLVSKSVPSAVMWLWLC